MNDMSAISQAFIKAPHFAVVGASVNREKFGNRILRWFVLSKRTRIINYSTAANSSSPCMKTPYFDICRYQSNSLDVTPVNPVSRNYIYMYK